MKNFYKKISSIFAIFLGIGLYFYNQIALAKVEVGEFLEKELPTVNSAGENPSSVIANIIVYLIGVVAILAIIAVTWAAIQMFLSMGDEQKFAKAKKILIMALVGVGVAGSGYFMVTVISRLSI